MGFKEMVEADRAVFMDFQCFGSRHTLEGKELTIVVDDSGLRGRQGSQELTVAESNIMFYAKTEELPRRLSPGRAVSYDNRECIVDDVAQDMGIVIVSLRQNRVN